MFCYEIKQNNWDQALYCNSKVKEEFLLLLYITVHKLFTI